MSRHARLPRQRQGAQVRGDLRRHRARRRAVDRGRARGRRVQRGARDIRSQRAAEESLTAASAPPDRIEERARFGYVRYANCWEDANVLCDALEPAPGKRILSIASGGDNSFALAADGAHVVAVDLSEAQLAM